MTEREFFRDEWEASYERGENNILYPQSEVVRFLNRFVTKKVDFHNTEQVMDRPDQGPLRCLDFACGVGVHSILCEEFGISATGVDISQTAISKAKLHARQKGYEGLSDRLTVVEQDKASLEFTDNWFDFSIAESCLDSMYFDNARVYFKELVRVSRSKIYFSVIGVNEDTQRKPEDVVVKTSHEFNTIQSYYDYDRILELIGGGEECLEFFMESREHRLFPKNSLESRFYVVVDVQKIKNGA
ncbi:class I SAM-dependent methyltransferase [Pseudomonadales bacterium]|nr:class I SAM-dependent methyltransferase [Pseudomonadales bacterium]